MWNCAFPINSQGLYLSEDVKDQYLQAVIALTDDSVRSLMISSLIRLISEGNYDSHRHN